MSMTLHGYYRSSTTYRVRIALNLKGCAYNIAPVNLLTEEQRSKNYLAKNPAGGVPTLEWDGRYYTQSLAILDLLEERMPEPSLWPAYQEARQLARELTYAIASETHAPNNLNRLVYLRTHFQAGEEELAAWVSDVITRTFTPIETRLAAQGASDALPFGAPTAFEIVLIPQIYNAQRFNVPLDEFPHLMRINEACASLDAFTHAAPENQPDSPQ